MSMSVADSASKLSQIIKIAGISIGAFESRNDGSGMVFYTDNLFELVGAEGPCDGDGYVSNKEFRERMNVLRDFVEESSEDGHVYTCRIPTESFTPRWISLKIVENASGVLGVASDITKETLEKRKIEHDRDYDLLTNILNRRAFHSILGKKLESPEEIKTAALVMLDLDNLKYINDTYGHDYGDDYIRHAAGVLKRLIPYRAVVARMSGDEFFVFIYGYDDKDELRKIINKMKEDFKNTLLPLPDNKVFRLRASTRVTSFTVTSANTVSPLAVVAAMRAVPGRRPVTSPYSSTVATDKSELVQEMVRLEALGGWVWASSWRVRPTGTSRVSWPRVTSSTSLVARRAIRG